MSWLSWPPVQLGCWAGTDPDTWILRSDHIILCFSPMTGFEFSDVGVESPKKPCLECLQTWLLCVRVSAGSGWICLPHQPTYVPVDAAIWSVVPATLSLMWIGRYFSLVQPNLSQAWLSCISVGIMAQVGQPPIKLTKPALCPSFLGILTGAMAYDPSLTYPQFWLSCEPAGAVAYPSLPAPCLNSCTYASRW